MGRRYIHGMSKTRIYQIWKDMRNRTTKTTHRDYKYYGGRGITLYSEWLDFKNFYRDMGEPPTPRHQIDRINNDLGYAPWNCRWVTPEEQIRNRRAGKELTINGETKSITEWARVNGINPKLAQHRRKSGWSLIDSVTIKPGIFFNYKKRQVFAKMKL